MGGLSFAVALSVERVIIATGMMIAMSSIKVVNEITLCS
jgi:hypothetical protein